AYTNPLTSPSTSETYSRRDNRSNQALKSLSHRLRASSDGANRGSISPCRRSISYHILPTASLSVRLARRTTTLLRSIGPSNGHTRRFSLLEISPLHEQLRIEQGAAGCSSDRIVHQRDELEVQHFRSEERRVGKECRSRGSRDAGERHAG